MTDRLTVLVLGVGGNVSQGILKALALSKLASRTVGACISPRSAGLYAVDRAYISPPAADPSFPDWLIDVCRRERVDAVLSGVEAVLDVLAQQQDAVRRDSGAVCIVSSPDRLRIANDKLGTAHWLAQQGLAFPATTASDDQKGIQRLRQESTFPLIAKPRHGRRSEGLLRIADPRDLDYALSRADYVIQEHLSEPEYTAGCVCDEAGDVRGTIVLRRDILNGTTHFAEAGDFPEVRAEAARIAAALRPRGPCNVQLRTRNGQPVCFEVNLRFSGTTPVRARLGFNEVDAVLRHFVRGEAMAPLPLVTRGAMLSAT